MIEVEYLVSKVKDACIKLLQKNEEHFDLASKTENPDSIYPFPELWLDDVTKNSDGLLRQIEAISTDFRTKTFMRKRLFSRSFQEKITTSNVNNV